MFPSPYSPASASAMSHEDGRCPARGRSYSRTWGTASTDGSSGSIPDEATGGVMRVLAYHATSRTTTCWPGWKWSRRGSRLRTPRVLPRPSGSPTMAVRRKGRGWGLGCARQMPRSGSYPELSPQHRLAPDSLRWSSCFTQYCPHTSPNPPPKKSRPLSDLALFTNTRLHGRVRSGRR